MVHQQRVYVRTSKGCDVQGRVNNDQYKIEYHTRCLELNNYRVTDVQLEDLGTDPNSKRMWVTALTFTYEDAPKQHRKVLYVESPKGYSAAERRVLDQQYTDRATRDLESRGYGIINIGLDDIGTNPMYPHSWTTRVRITYIRTSEVYAKSPLINAIRQATDIIEGENMKKKNSVIEDILAIDNRIKRVSFSEDKWYDTKEETIEVRVDMKDGRAWSKKLDMKYARYSPQGVDGYIIAEIKLGMPPNMEKILFIGGPVDGEWREIVESALWWNVAVRNPLTFDHASGAFPSRCTLRQEVYERQRIHVGVTEYRDIMVIRGMTMVEVMSKMFRQYKGE